MLLEKRGGAAKDIELVLDPAEAAMLGSVPRQQLVQIIDQTFVPDEQRRAFLGRVAMVMLAALGGGMAGCGNETAVTLGVQPDRPPPPGGNTGQVTNTPVQTIPDPGSAGIRPQPPRTNGPSNLTSRGIQPDRP